LSLIRGFRRVIGLIFLIRGGAFRRGPWVRVPGGSPLNIKAYSLT
jgi:hypothetical protein